MGKTFIIILFGNYFRLSQPDPKLQKKFGFFFASDKLRQQFKLDNEIYLKS